MDQPRPSVSCPVLAVRPDGEDGLSDYRDCGDQRTQVTQVTVQAKAAIIAGFLGILAIILETVGFTKSIDEKRCEPYPYCYQIYPAIVGPGVAGGVLCLFQAVWAGFILANVKKTSMMNFQHQASRRSPMPITLLCNVSSFTTLTAFSTAWLVAVGSLSFFFNGSYGIALAVISLCMCVACFVATVAGSCAICKAGCGCTCCEYPTDTQVEYQPVDGTPACAVAPPTSGRHYRLNSTLQQS